ncbi:MAG: hypothetical protein ACREP7_22290, partial [Lysobacter sp.]
QVLYDNQLLPDGQWQHPVGARAAVEAERNRPLTPQQWKEHIQSFDEIQANQQRPGRNATPVEVDEVRHMRTASVREGGLTAQAGLHPVLARGAIAAGAAATAVDAVTSGGDVARLYDQDNAVGAESQMLHFGARNVGGWAGAVAGAKLGTLAGIESGPGMVITGIVGAGIGAWTADKAVAWIEQERINTQADNDGNTWRFDPKSPEQGWTRQVDSNEIDLNTSNAYAAAKTGATFYTQETLTADATQTQLLNYKASTLSVQLRLADPDIPLDPYRIAADSRDTPSLRDSPWTRNAQTGEWTRQVADGLIDRSMHTTAQKADPQKKAELDAYAQSTIGYNAARSSASVAHRYEQTYAALGWPVPNAIAQAAPRCWRRTAIAIRAATMGRGQTAAAKPRAILKQNWTRPFKHNRKSSAMQRRN